MRNIFNQIPYVCKITGYTGRGNSYNGTGVFVSPQHILTAWHNLKEKIGGAVYISNRKIFNEAVAVAVSPSKNVAVDPLHDVALLRLPQPLSTNFAKVAHNFTSKESVFLASYKLFGSKTMSGKYLGPNLDACTGEDGLRPMTEFEYTRYTRKGMSGSPITNTKGEIVSIHIGKAGVIQRIRRFPLPPIGNSIGVTPERLFQFYEPYRAHVESCCPNAS